MGLKDLPRLLSGHLHEANAATCTEAPRAGGDTQGGRADAPPQMWVSKAAKGNM